VSTVSNARELLAELQALGVTLWVEQERLRYRAPKGVLDPDRLDAMRRHKAELLTLLNDDLFAPIPALPAQEHYELSDAQRRLWVLAQMEAGSAAYNIPLHQWLEGELDAAALSAALQKLIERHESLRTTFVTIAGEPRQCIVDSVDFRFEVTDLSHDPQAETAARELGQAAATQPFDLEQGPLLRAGLLKLGKQRHVLLLTVHHSVCDGVSIALLEHELAVLYRACKQGEADPLPPLRIHYRDFAHWQNRLLESPAIAPQRAYWLDRLSGELPVLNLPLDFPRPPLQTFNGRELAFVLDSERTQALATLARRQNASLFIVLLAVLKTLLHRYTGQRDIIVGSPCAGRDHPDLEAQIGFYLNMLALRDEVDGEQPFSDFLEQVRRGAMRAYDHQFYPFDRLIDELSLARDLSRSPLFDVILILQNQADAGFVFDDLTTRPFFEHPGTSKVDLTFYFKETPQGLILGLEYNTDLFQEDRIRRLAAHFFTLVDSILAAPDQLLGKLNLLPAAERQQVLVDFNATAVDYPRAKILPDLLAEQTARCPDAIAVECNEQALSYRQLDARANALARRLQALGVGPNRLVGLCAERSMEMLLGALAILKAGGAYVPLDPAYPAARLAFMLEDANLAGLVTQRHLQAHLPPVDVPTLFLDDPAESAPPPLCRATARDLAYVIYTSGSTGKPKGVAVTHGGLVNFLRDMTRRFECTNRDTLLAVTTLSFDIAALELYLPLLTGARLLLADRATAADGRRLAALTNQATLMQATPATWRLLLDAGWNGHAALKILCGGEALDWELAEQLRTRGAGVWNLYGPTETTIWSAVQPLPEASSAAQVPIGRPIANTQVYVLERYLEPAPIGVPGELCIGGAGLALGYLGRPALTAEKFLPNPFSTEPGTRLYRSGDLACWRADGTLEFFGRIDQQVKIRGFRIELGEIEAALHAQPSVRQAVVLARDDPPDGKRLVAYIVPAVPAGEISADDLRPALKRTLPEFMIPTAFVTLDALPLTPNGKVQRQALPPPESPSRITKDHAPPRDALEQQLVEAFQTILAVDVMGIHNEFFELGGHSLKAARLVSQLRQQMNIELNLIDIFRQPTVAGLAELLRQREPVAPMRSLTADSPIAGAAPTAAEWDLLQD